MTHDFDFDPDYTIEDIFWSHPKAVLVRARSTRRLGSCLLKIARNGGDPAASGAWEAEYNLLSKLWEKDGESGPELEFWKGLPFLVLPDTGALPLSRHEKCAFADSSIFLAVAYEICRQLEKLHQEKFLHQFLAPDNILVNRVSLKVRLIGFAHASPFFSKARGAFDLRMREGLLQYAAPEQTGMINRLMDGRTDIYALGCLFFEMLTGKAVCESVNPSEILAFHVAGTPPLKDLDPIVPEAVSAVIEKCLAKEPDERYQTVGGLRADISACREKLRKNGKIASFTPGRHDHSPFLRFSGRIVGRADEIKQISGMVDRVSQGGRCTVLVAGPAGVGKTALVSEIFPLLAARRIPLLSGKFDSVVENRPYAGICRAISSWATSVSFEDETRQCAWAEKLGVALGGLERIIVDLAPETSFIFDSPPSLPDFPPKEAQGRFFLALSRFFSAIAKDEGLALFMDDLQWADHSTLSFLAHAATGAVSGGFFLVGAFRDNEISQGSPINDLLAVCSLRREESRLIRLHPLSLSDTAALVSEVCGGAEPKGGELAEYLFERTSGNPFFVKGLLSSLIEDGCLFFDPKSKKFFFNAQKASVGPDIPDQRSLLRSLIMSFSGPCQEMLCVAAAVGDSFSPKTVAELLSKSISEVENALSEALNKRLIRPVSGRNGGQWYNFVHDHVREEAYAMLPYGRAAAMHLALSGLQQPGMDKSEAVFWAADHINRAKELVTAEKDSMEAAVKNLEAGRLARESAAFGSAWRYLSAAVEFLTDNSWKKHYKTALEIYTAAAEAAYLAADKHVASRLSAIIAKEAKSDMERAEALRLAMLALTAQNRQAEAIATGLKALRALGIRMPANPGKHHLLYYFVKARLTLPKRKWNKLLARPVGGPARKALAMSIYPDLGLAAFGIKPNLSIIAGLHQLALMAKGRFCPQAASALAGYGFIMAQAGNQKDAYEIGILAEKLQKRWPGHVSEATTLMIVNSMIRPLREHLRESYAGLQLAFQSGVKAGNFYWGTMAAWVRCYQMLYAGVPLCDVLQEMWKVRDEFKVMGQEKACLYTDMDILFVMALSGAPEKEISAQREAFGNPDNEESLLEADDDIALNILFSNRLFMEYLLGNYASAAEAGRRLDDCLNGAAGTQAVPVTDTFECLAMLAMPSFSAGNTRFKKKVARLSGWAKNCPQNNLHKLYLVKAELARVEGRNAEARKLYNDAVKEAHDNGFMNFEALALELFAKFCLLNNCSEEGRKLMADARTAYAAWGANAKVKILDEKYGAFFLRNATQTAAPTLSRNRPSLAGLADSSVIIDQIEARLMETAPEDRAVIFLSMLCPITGASAGRIFIKGQRVLAVRAIWGENVIGTDGPEFFSGDDLARHFARKALRLGEWILVPDMEKEDLPIKFLEVRNSAPRSVFCGPLEMDWKRGVLYLENRFLTNAFDPMRLSLIKTASKVFMRLPNPLGKLNK